MTNNLIENSEPLQSNYIPSTFTGRENEQTALTEALPAIADGSRGNLHIQGEHGIGKTHLTQSVRQQLPDHINTSYISCIQNNTQYKTLKQLYSSVTGESIETGYHTSELQRRIEKRTTQIPLVVVLDDIEFLLLNNGDDLLYYLSRTGENVSAITISSSQLHLRTEIEERTYSSLQPQNMVFDSYEPEQVYEILANRARTALSPQSLHREALTYISSRTQNISLGLHWLRTAAEKANSPITVGTIKKVQSTAYRGYVDSLLSDFTPHHKRLFQALVELTTENDQKTVLQTGTVYDRYEDLCSSYSQKSLSNRRVSDYLKHLELLDLIDANYHYGGRKGKTREIRIKTLLNDISW